MFVNENKMISLTITITMTKNIINYSITIMKKSLFSLMQKIKMCNMDDSTYMKT